jgi:general stress protein YciG
MTITSNRRGFAAMSEAQRREIARKGGQAAQRKGTGHRFTSEEARRAGRKGGQTVSQDREYMARIGRDGGARSASVRRRASIVGSSRSEPQTGKSSSQASRFPTE